MKPRPNFKHILIAELTKAPGSLLELQHRTGLAKTTVWRMVMDMHEATPPQVHVIGWARSENGGPNRATYAAGPGVDVPCKINRYTVAQRSARHQKKAKTDETWDLRKARARAMHWAERARTHPDPLVLALFGPARMKQKPQRETLL